MKINFTYNSIKATPKCLIILVVLLLANQTFGQVVNLTKGLVAYYPFSGNDKDSSGKNNNPSFNNATLTIDRFGNPNSAYSFDGNSSYIQIPASLSLDTGTMLSLSYWVYVKAFYTGQCTENYVLSKGVEATNNYNSAFGNQAYGSQQGINFCNVPADTSHEAPYGLGVGSLLPNFHTGSWYHVVITNNGSISILYVNGSLVAATAATVTFNTNDIFLGRYFDLSKTPYWLNGTLDDIRIYNRAITNDEVAALYNAPNPITPNDCTDKNNSQLVIKVDTANRKGYKVATITNQNTSADTTLGSVRLFTWTANGGNYNGRTLMQYQLTQIPTNAIINSAKLYLYAKTQGTSEGVAGQPTYGSNNTSVLQKLTSTWQLNSVRFNNLPSIDPSSQVIIPQSTNTAEDYVVDITKLTQFWVNKPDSNFGFMLKIQTENNPYNTMLFESGAASDPTRNARFEICYTVPPPPANDCANGNNSQLVLRADTTKNNPFIIGVVDNYWIKCDPSKHEINAFTWTANSVGVPDYDGRSFITFNNLKNIPTTAKINSAKLYLYAKTTNALNGVAGQPTYGINNITLLQRCIKPWDLSALSWTNQPTTDTSMQKILPQSTSTSEDYIVDISDFVQNWVNKPDSNFGLMLRMQTENNPYNSMLFEGGEALDSTRNARLEICYSLSGGLPVTLKSFTANAITSPYTKINFTTENEVNTASIEIDRSYDGVKFSKASLLSSKAGNGLNNYSYVDMVNASEAKVYYRLKLINKDGSFKYSQVVSVALGMSVNQKSITADVYPNPVRGNDLNMNLYLLKDEALTIRIIDMSGKLISENRLQANKGYSSLVLPAFKNASAGIYTVSILSSGEIENKKVIKIN